MAGDAGSDVGIPISPGWIFRPQCVDGRTSAHGESGLLPLRLFENDDYEIFALILHIDYGHRQCGHALSGRLSFVGFGFR